VTLVSWELSLAELPVQSCHLVFFLCVGSLRKPNVPACVRLLCYTLARPRLSLFVCMDARTVLILYTTSMLLVLIPGASMIP
jgi:hypothetical protein